MGRKLPPRPNPKSTKRARARNWEKDNHFKQLRRSDRDHTEAEAQLRRQQLLERLGFSD